MVRTGGGAISVLVGRGKRVASASRAGCAGVLVAAGAWMGVGVAGPESQALSTRRPASKVAAIRVMGPFCALSIIGFPFIYWRFVSNN
jgi:hypothetical protein